MFIILADFSYFGITAQSFITFNSSTVIGWNIPHPNSTSSIVTDDLERWRMQRHTITVEPRQHQHMLLNVMLYNTNFEFSSIILSFLFLVYILKYSNFLYVLIWYLSLHTCIELKCIMMAFKKAAGNVKTANITNIIASQEQYFSTANRSVLPIIDCNEFFELNVKH